MKKIRILSIIIVISLCLTACSQKVDYYFNENETWKISSMLEYDPRTLSYLSSILQSVIGEAVGEDLSFIPDDISGDMIEGILSMFISTIDLEGIDVSVRQGVSTSTRQEIYITFAGQDLQQINTLAPGYVQLTQIDADTYRLQMQVIELGEIDGFDLSVLNAAYKQTIIIHAGQILDSNADTQTSRQAIWNSPRSIDVTFKLAPAFPTWILWLLGLVVASFIMIKFIAGGSKRKCSGCGTKVDHKEEYCPECGNPLY